MLTYACVLCSQGEAGRLHRDRDRHEMVRAADEYHGGHSGGATRAVFRNRVVCRQPSRKCHIYMQQFCRVHAHMYCFALFFRFLDPIFFGDYPRAMREILQSNLPTFTAEEKKLLLQYKPDFIGLNHYTAIYAKDCIHSPCNLQTYEGNAFVLATGEKDGVKIGRDVRTSTILAYKRANHHQRSPSLFIYTDSTSCIYLLHYCSYTVKFASDLYYKSLADGAVRFLRCPRSHRAGYHVCEREVQGHAGVYH